MMAHFLADTLLLLSSLAYTLPLRVVFGDCFAALLPDARLVYSQWMLCHHGFIAFVGDLC
jgi:hypothetical protein